MLLFPRILLILGKILLARCVGSLHGLLLWSLWQWLPHRSDTYVLARWRKWKTRCRLSVELIRLTFGICFSHSKSILFWIKDRLSSGFQKAISKTNLFINLFWLLISNIPVSLGVIYIVIGETNACYNVRYCSDLWTSSDSQICDLKGSWIALSPVLRSFLQ